MARKKKDRIMAFEVLQPDTLHPETQRICRNFVCYESNVKDCLVESDRRESWKHDENTQREFDIICGYQTELRGGMGNLGMDLVSLVPVTLEKSVKSTTPYIYRTMDYSLNKPVETYGTRKDALAFIQKHIKTKNVIMHYDGVTERGELDLKRIEEIFSTIETDTIEFDIAQVGRNDMEGDIILVTIYKNLLK